MYSKEITFMYILLKEVPKTYRLQSRILMIGFSLNCYNAQRHLHSVLRKGAQKTFKLLISGLAQFSDLRAIFK